MQVMETSAKKRFADDAANNKAEQYVLDKSLHSDNKHTADIIMLYLQ